MAVELNFDGTTFELEDDVIDSITFRVDSPEEVDSKGAISRICLIIKGNILNVSGEKTVEFARWASSATRSGFTSKAFTAKCVNKNKTVRQYELKQAFVVDYTESYDNGEGSGTFELVINQTMSDFKKDKSNVTVSGGF